MYVVVGVGVVVVGVVVYIYIVRSSATLYIYIYRVLDGLVIDRDLYSYNYHPLLSRFLSLRVVVLAQALS